MSPAKCCCIICKSCMERSLSTRLLTCPASPNSIVRPILLDVYTVTTDHFVYSCYCDPIWHTLSKTFIAPLYILLLQKRHYFARVLIVCNVPIASYPGLPCLFCCSVCIQYNSRRQKNAKNREGLGTPVTWTRGGRGGAVPNYKYFYRLRTEDLSVMTATSFPARAILAAGHSSNSMPCMVCVGMLVCVDGSSLKPRMDQIGLTGKKFRDA